MNICCTKKLQEELTIKPSAPEAIDPLFSWHANFLRINRKKAVVLVNDASRYNVILYGLKAKDLGRLADQIPQAIRETLLSEGVNPEIIDDYLSAAGAPCFTKTNGAKSVAWLNKGCETADIFSEQYADSVIVQTDIAKKRIVTSSWIWATKITSILTMYSMKCWGSDSRSRLSVARLSK